MYKTIKRTLSAAVLTTAVATLAACGGDSGSGAGDTGASQLPAQGSAEGTTPAAALASSNFTFPQVSNVNGAYSVEIPAGPAPAFSARQTLANGTGSTVEFGDPVVVAYTMFNWSQGALVESTAEFEDPLTVRAGISEGVPDYLSKSLLGRKIGDKLQVIFEAGMEDLPSYLDGNDAYVLVVDLM